MMKRLLYILFCGLPVVGWGQVISTVAGGGSGSSLGDGGPATSAKLGYISGIAFDKKGNLYIGDPNNYRIRKVDGSTGVISTIAGTGSSTYSGDGGPALMAGISWPDYIATDTSNGLFVVDHSNRVRKIDLATGYINTFAGNGNATYFGDGGLAVNASFLSISTIATDLVGNLYVVDAGSRIRKIDAVTGVISTVAGNGTIGFSGDGGVATLAQIYAASLVIDSIGNLFIADWNNGRIRKVSISTGIIETIAGNGNMVFAGDGVPAISTSVNAALLAFDAYGSLFLSEQSGSDRVRRINVNGIISTVAGNGTAGFSGDGGPSLLAQLHTPGGIAFDTCNNMFVADQQNKRVRRVSFNPHCWPLNVNEIKPLTFTLSPNPTTSQITITSTSKLKEISICNMLGQRVLRQGGATDRVSVDVEGLMPGVYFVEVRNVNGGVRVEKVVKE